MDKLEELHKWLCLQIAEAYKMQRDAINEDERTYYLFPKHDYTIKALRAVENKLCSLK